MTHMRLTRKYGAISKLFHRDENADLETLSQAHQSSAISYELYHTSIVIEFGIGAKALLGAAIRRDPPQGFLKIPITPPNGFFCP
jgi:hypothetical protein